ncbi:MAG: hypothetical protein BGO90_13990 [Legionella sp. 40-6]|nr:MAG: hypothetical protein BGO90_13990 [Legionella sp. 40-6]
MNKFFYRSCYFGVLGLMGCSTYSGYATSSHTDIYNVVDTSPIPGSPTLSEMQEADRIQSLREQLFDLPIDRSHEWPEEEEP